MQMRRYLPVLTLLGLAALGSPGGAGADTITYVESVTASGSLDGVDFTNQTLTLTAVGDPSAVFNGGPGTFDINLSLTATIGATTDQLTGSYEIQDFQNLQLFNSGVIATTASAYASYDLTTAIGPVAGSVYEFGANSYATQGGELDITSVTGNVTFGATVASAVPEPSSVVLAAIGIAAVTGYQLRRRKLARA
jgi:hypothetical protein